MNQQRSRRFRSAKERAEEHERLMAEDPVYVASKHEPFDSNCITPGTEFMRKLSEALRYFVAKKVTEDRRWQNISVILSGAEVPGEGEHKIMEYIRAVRESGALQPNTRHCVYGLDADLIMLALVTHEPHFFILREKVDFAAFWRKKGGPRVATTLDTAVFGEFEFLSVGVLREYLALDLGADGNSSLPFFDVERIADDFVFILMLIGNDFLPHLPTLDISTGTLGVMLHLYKRLLPTMGGYLTNGGKIIASRLDYFFAKLGMLDKRIMRSRYEAEEHASRGNRRYGKSAGAQTGDLDVLFGFGSSGARKVSGPLSERELEQETALSRQRVKDGELLELKAKYYDQKFGAEFGVPGSAEFNDLTQCYVEGIWWTLRYYVEGCRHWRWFYPYHYSPLASDLNEVSSKLAVYEQRKFVSDQPFRPLEQLLSVLPQVSSWCLPKPYRQLMINPSSPIRDFYPEDFIVDMNGKRNEWEAVVLLPFVDETRLLRAIESIPLNSLTSEEKQRNKHGSSFVYRYCLTWSQQHVSPFATQLPSLVSRAKSVELKLPGIQAGKSFSARKLPGTRSPVGNSSLADMPSLHVFLLRGSLSAAGVNIFGTASRSESLVIEPILGSSTENTGDMTSTGDLASDGKVYSHVESQGLSVGSAVWYGYPWRAAGQIDYFMNTAVTKRMSRIQNGVHSAEIPAKVEVKPTNKTMLKREVDVMVANMAQRHGVALSAPNEVVGVREVSESGTAPSGADSESTIGIWHPYFVRRRDVMQPEGGAMHSSAERLTEGQMVLFVGSGVFFGHKATVKAVLNNGMVSVEFRTVSQAAREPAFGYRVVDISNNQQRWVTLSKLAADVGIPASLADYFLGSVRVRLQSAKEEIDLGLGVKYIGRSLYIPGYARPDERQHYSFSEKAIDVLRRYKNAFPQFFASVGDIRLQEAKSGNGKNRGNVVYSSKDLFGKRGDDAARAISTWLSVQEVANLPLVPAMSSVLSQSTVVELEKQASLALALQKDYEATFGKVDASRRTIEVARQSLLTGAEGAQWGIGWSLFSFSAPIAPDCTGVRLGDRVVNRLAEGGVPFGLRGTVVGIYPPAALDTATADMGDSGVVEVVFDEGFIGGSTLNGRCSEGRGKAVPANTLFIVRPYRDNVYYSKHYARIAAQIGSTLTGGNGHEEEQSKQAEEIAKASVKSYADAVRRPVGRGGEKTMVGKSGHRTGNVAEDGGKEGGSKNESNFALFVAGMGSREIGEVRQKGSVVGTSTWEDIRLQPESLPLPRFVKGRKRETVAIGVNEGKGSTRKRMEVNDVAGVMRIGEDDAGDSVGDMKKGEKRRAIQDAALLAELLKRDLGITDERGSTKDDMSGKGDGEKVAVDGNENVSEGDEDDELTSMWAQLQREEGRKSCE